MTFEQQCEHLAERSRQFDRACDAVMARDDTAFRDAMNKFWGISRERGGSNVAPVNK